MNRRKYGVLGLVLLLVLVGAVWRMFQPPLVEMFEVQAAPLVRTIQFSARVSALSRVDLGSTVTGRIERVLVREGAAVQAGQLLASLESTEQRAALWQAKSAEQQAELRLTGLRTTARAQAAAGLVQAQATLSQARAEHERAQQLVTQGFVTGSRLDDARRALEVAQAQVSSASALVQANAETGNDIVQAQEQLKGARAATAAAAARVALTDIRSPADGRVLSRDVEPGQVVQAGRALFGLSLAGPTLIKAQADERFLEELRPGQPAWVVADAFAGQRFAAVVQSLAPMVDAQRGAVEVKLALKDAAPDFLRQDMTLSVEVETAQRDKTLVLPLDALRGTSTGDTASVLVWADAKLVLRQLRLGLRTLEGVEVLEGLKEGEAVALGSQLVPGQRARPAWVAVPATTKKSASKGIAAATLTNAMGR